MKLIISLLFITSTTISIITYGMDKETYKKTPKNIPIKKADGYTFIERSWKDEYIDNLTINTKHRTILALALREKLKIMPNRLRGYTL